nr:GTPase-associated system all-helical protein GASH [uncultured Cohaesibacter sp.]
MQQLKLADCYGYAGLSPDAVNIPLRIEPFKKIAENLTRSQIIDTVRAYFGMPMQHDTGWLSDPISETDEAFSMVTNKNELAIFAMALIAHQMREEDDQFTALVFLVANACGHRKASVYPQFVEIMKAAASDLTTSTRCKLDMKSIRARALNKGLGGSEKDLIPPNDFAAVNDVVKAVNLDSHDMTKHLAQQINATLSPMRSEVARLREETDMLWWLIGGESRLVCEPYADMKPGRAAFLIGSELAGLSRTCLGPKAATFLINKALRDGRTDKLSKVKIEDVPKLFALEELSDVTPDCTISDVRDLCSVGNAIARASEAGSQTAWKKRYHEDGSLSATATFSPSDLAIQSFREFLLLNTLSS